MDGPEYPASPSPSPRVRLEGRWPGRGNRWSYKERKPEQRERACKTQPHPGSPHTPWPRTSHLSHTLSPQPLLQEALQGPPSTSRPPEQILLWTELSRPRPVSPQGHPGGTTTPVPSPPSTELGTQSEFSGCLLIKTWGQDAGQPCSLGCCV